MLPGLVLPRAGFGDPHAFRVADLMSVISLPVERNIWVSTQICIYMWENTTFSRGVFIYV